jgi:hypothetical protein
VLLSEREGEKSPPFLFHSTFITEKEKSCSYRPIGVPYYCAVGSVDPSKKVMGSTPSQECTVGWKKLRSANGSDVHLGTIIQSREPDKT